MIIDCHAHLWKRQNGAVDGKAVYHIANGISDFGGEARQMMPPYMIDGENTAERFIANMDYAGVSGAVITQEEIDGNQDEYLLSVKRSYSDRFKICSLYEEGKPYRLSDFDGIKICAGRLKNPDLTKHCEVFENASRLGKFISIDLAEGDSQTASLREMALQYPNLKIAIGHFGMVGREGWIEQIKLARLSNVFVESGGITWLYNSEFYPYPTAVRSILEASEVCGFDKLMWGSDYPRTMVEITYKMSFDFITKSSLISDSDKEKFLCKNAISFYGFTDIKPLKNIPNML